MPKMQVGFFFFSFEETCSWEMMSQEVHDLFLIQLLDICVNPGKLLTHPAPLFPSLCPGMTFPIPVLGPGAGWPSCCASLLGVVFGQNKSFYFT